MHVTAITLHHTTSASQFGKTPKGTKIKETKTIIKNVFRWAEKRGNKIILNKGYHGEAV